MRSRSSVASSGPLYGAVVLAVGSWHTIFWLNLAVGAVLAAGLVVLSGSTRTPGTPTSAVARFDWIGVALGLVALVALGLVMVEPDRLTSGITTGRAFIPYVGDTRWSNPMAMTCFGAAALFVARQLTARRPLVNLRGLSALSHSADLGGAALLGLSLAGVVLAFATADPEVQVFSPLGPWFLVASAACAVLFAWRQRSAEAPLIPTGSLSARSAWGALAVSFFIGASLIAALVDIPIFARITVYSDSQLDAALVLVRLLAALPIGAIVGGWLLSRFPVGALSAGGMLLAAGSFGWMAQWDRTSLDSWTPTVPLVLCGFGFGLAIAPVNAALLAWTRTEVHGIASALLVVARMVGMLVGISALTTIGLRRFYAESEGVPPVADICKSAKVCDDYLDLLKDVGITQTQTIFIGAAVCAVIAAVLSLLLLRPITDRAVTSST